MQVALKNFFNSIDDFSNDYEKERLLYSLSGLLSLPKQDLLNLNTGNSSFLRDTVQKAFHLAQEIIKLREKDSQEQNNEAIEEGGQLKKGTLGTESDDGKPENFSDWYTDNLHKYGNKDETDIMESDSDDSDWDGEDDFMQDEMDFEYDSPLNEEHCPILYLKSIMSKIESEDKEYCMQLLGVLHKDVQENVGTIFAKAEEYWNSKKQNKLGDFKM